MTRNVIRTVTIPLVLLTMSLAALNFSQAGASADAAPAPEQRSDFDVTIDLRDGSHLLGRLPRNTSYSLRTDYGTVQAPLSAMRELDFVDAERAELSLLNGDRMTGRFNDEVLRLTTAFGAVAIPRPIVARLKPVHPVALRTPVLDHASQGKVVVVHRGGNEPTSEGWSKVHAVGVSSRDGLGDVIVGPILDDMGFDAWEIDDASTATGSNGAYARNLTAVELTAAMTQGFKLSARLKVANVPDTRSGINASVLVEFFTGSVRWQMAFGADADGDPFVRLFDDGSFNGPTHILEGTGGGYHLYELVYDPRRSVAVLLVDGIEQASFDGRPFRDPRPVVKFGSGQNSDEGRGRYSLVQFEILPTFFWREIPASGTTREVKPRSVQR
ncbi:MAG: hypothetical protein CMJ18_03085 [Phycisphaeraceae bacterium]|nr:hypothetical protein [Phycisphaeraceae bacterium]